MSVLASFLCNFACVHVDARAAPPATASASTGIVLALDLPQPERVSTLRLTMTNTGCLYHSFSRVFDSPASAP